MRQGRRMTSPSVLAGGEHAEQRAELEWGASLVGERLLAAAQVATAIHMALDTDLRRPSNRQRDERAGRARL